MFWVKPVYRDHPQCYPQIIVGGSTDDLSQTSLQRPPRMLPPDYSKQRQVRSVLHFLSRWYSNSIKQFSCRIDWPQPSLNFEPCIVAEKGLINTHFLRLARQPDFMPNFPHWTTYQLTLSHSEPPKQAWQFWKYFLTKAFFGKMFEEEMLTRSQTTTLLQIFCEFSLYSQVIFKSMKIADDIS